MGILIQAGPKFLGTPLSAVARVDITLIAPTTTALAGRFQRRLRAQSSYCSCSRMRPAAECLTFDVTKFKIVTNSGWQIDGTPSSVTVFRFTGSSAGFWWLSATPITGQTP
jgi:hypothetical protein